MRNRFIETLRAEARRRWLVLTGYEVHCRSWGGHHVARNFPEAMEWVASYPCDALVLVTRPRLLSRLRGAGIRRVVYVRHPSPKEVRYRLAYRLLMGIVRRRMNEVRELLTAA